MTSTMKLIASRAMAGMHRECSAPAGAAYPANTAFTATAVPFGVDEHGGALTVDLTGGSVLLTGAPGSGKTVGIRALLAGLSRLPHVALVGLDATEVALAAWRPRFSLLTARADEATTALESLVAEVDRRFAWLERHGLRRLGPAQITEEMPLIVLVVDELQLVVDGLRVDPEEAHQHRTSARLLRRVVGDGRDVGVVTIAATACPRHDVLPAELRDLFATRIAYATSTEALTDAFVGRSLAQAGCLSHLIPYTDRGVCFVATTTECTPVPTRTRAYWVPEFGNSPSMTWQIAAATAGLRIELAWLPT